MIKAFRDTWELGIHSYLTYLRDRLLAREGTAHASLAVSLFRSPTRTSTVSRVSGRSFRARQFRRLDRLFRRPAAIRAIDLASVGDYLVWYAKDKPQTEVPATLFDEKRRRTQGRGEYDQFELRREDGAARSRPN